MSSNDDVVTKPASLIVKLEILDAYGRKAESPYRLKNGSNRFSCEATYIDKTKEIFKAYWTCPMILARGGVDFYGALETARQNSVTINAAPNHIRHAELACWVKFPNGPNTDANQYPRATIGFDYSEVADE